MIILQRLSIRDFAIVAQVEIEFADGLTVVTGETGAGKSLLLGAFTLLLGDRASSEYIRSGSRRATIEAQFSGDLSRLRQVFADEDLEFDPAQLILTREINVDGRSRCLVNDQRANLSVMRQLGRELCDLHGQHQHQWLLEPARHLWFLDQFAGCDDMRQHYARQFAHYRRTRLRVGELEQQLAAEQERRELYSFQLAELDEANVGNAEEEQLELESRELENVNRIKQALHNSAERLDSEVGLLNALAEIKQDLESVAGLSRPVSPLLGELETARVTLAELNRSLSEQASRLEENPRRLEELAERLSDIYNLKRKYGGTVESLHQYHEEISSFLEAGDSTTGELEQLRIDLQGQAENLLKIAGDLQSAREKGGRKLRKQIGKVLLELGMPEAGFEVEFSEPEGGELIAAGGEERRLAEQGLRQAQFIFSANPGEPAKPLARIASGGEISRVMLALKSLIAGRDQVDVLLFDEIDTGIGGATATLVGKKLQQLAADHQVIVVTHLQQIAACANHHFRAAKEQAQGRSQSILKKLDHEERLVELGRMISGGGFGEEEKRQAEKLLSASREKLSVDSN